MRQEHHQRDLLIAGGLSVLLFIGLASGPPPDGAFGLILGYFVCIALWGAVELVLRPKRLSPPEAEGPTPPVEPPVPPAEPSPAGVPLGPRKPAPLVAHAVAEEPSDTAT